MAPESIPLYRAFGLDAARHFSLFGSYPRSLAIPDRWASWRFRAVPMAQRIIRDQGVDAVWSTFPVATAHRIGLEIARRSGLPWIAEFRDPMWQGDYPHERAVNRAWLLLEQKVFSEASAVVVTTPGAAVLYRDRYPAFDSSKIKLIENGFDERTFQQAEASLRESGEGDVNRSLVTLLHSGIVYPSERDPTQLFAAIAALKDRRAVDSKRLRIILRASGNDRELSRQIDSSGIGDIVKLEPAIDYVSALREMICVDGLLILQASNCNAQVPAKIYEYFRARRPILALTDPLGDTARTLRTAGMGIVAPLDSQGAIEAAVVRFMIEVKEDSWKRMSSASIERYSREAQTKLLGELLDSLCNSSGRMSD